MNVWLCWDVGQFFFVDRLCDMLKYYSDEVTFQGNYSLQEPESGKFEKKKKNNGSCAVFRARELLEAVGYGILMARL